MISGEQLREEKKGKVPVSFPTWCLAAPMQKVLSGASVGILPFGSTLMRTLTLWVHKKLHQPFTFSLCRLVPSYSSPRKGDLVASSGSL